jgi:hypothetical protein
VRLASGEAYIGGRSHRMRAASVAACIGLCVFIADASAWQGIQLRTRTGANAEIAERLEGYRPGVTPVVRISQEELWGGAVDFKRAATAWIDAAVSPLDQPRRRLVVATYALELLKEPPSAATAGRQNRTSTTGSAFQLLDWACATLRKSDPHPSETAWHVAAFALLERAGAPLAGHLEHAETRFPAGDHWLLVRALIDELESEPGRRDDGTLSISGRLVSRATQHFQAAAARPSTRQQALIRWAAFESDLGRQDIALSRLDSVGPLESEVLRYWAGMIRGRALERGGRGPEAIEAYRAVAAEFPNAQTAGLSLAAALVGANRVAEAARVVSTAIGFAAGATPPPDPWDFYRSPDTLLWSRALDEIRRGVTR